MDFSENNIAFQHLVDVICAKKSVALPISELVNVAVREGMASLLYRQISDSVTSGSECNEYAELYRRAVIAQAASIVRLDALTELLKRADELGLPIVLMKGISLGYQIYQDASFRPSSDMDIFIDEDQIPQVVQMFRDLDYIVDAPVEKSMISFQFSALKQSNTGHTIIFDIHYKINNQAEYESVFGYSKVSKRAVPVPAISEHAKALCFADAYTYACVHLHGHYLLGDPVKGIWLYDIHLLLEAMTEQDQVQALDIIGSGSIGGVCQYWTKIVVDNFSTKVPPRLQRALAELPKLTIKPSVKVNPVKLLWDQFVFLPDARARLTFLRQLFIPPKQRLREKYPNSRLWLPILYLRRAVTGFWGRILKIGK